MRKPLFSGWWLILIISVLGSALFGWWMFGDSKDYVVGASSHRLAPSTAKEISYYERRNISGVICVSYLVGERDFREFALDQGWKLEPRTQGPSDFTASQPEAWARGAINGPHPEIGNCLFYEERQANGGGITVIYDLVTSRAIINRSSC